MSTNLTITILVVGLSLGIGVTILFFMPLLKKKGVNVEEIEQKTDKVLAAADGVLKVADTLLPSNPVVNILKVIDNIVHKGVTGAEQMYIASELQADQRNAKAKELIYAALKVLNVEATPEISTVIDGSIEAEVLALGHKTQDEAEKQKQVQAQIQNIQTQNTQLQQQNTDLQNQNQQIKNVLSAVQNTVQAIPTE